MKQLVLLACACLLGCAAASATTIDFNMLAGSGAFSSYTEGGYSVTATTGSWMVASQNGFGNPGPSIFTSMTGGTVSVSRGSAATFTFSGVDLAELHASGNDYTIDGELHGSRVFTVSGALTSAFLHYGTVYGADTIDRLTIHFSHDQDNVDNIVVTDTPIAATPEPGSLALVLTGAAGMAAMLRRRITGGLRS